MVMQEVPLLQPPDLCSATPASQPEVPSPPQPTLPPQHFLSSHSQATETPSLFLELGEELQHPHMQKPPRSSTLRGWADGTFESSSACLACLPVSPASIPDLFLTLGIHKMVVSHVFWGLSHQNPYLLLGGGGAGHSTDPRSGSS